MNGIYIVNINIHKFNSTSLNTKNIFIMKFKKIISKENSNLLSDSLFTASLVTVQKLAALQIIMIKSITFQKISFSK